MLTWISRRRRPPTSSWRRMWPTSTRDLCPTTSPRSSTAAATALRTPARSITRGMAVTPSSVVLAPAKRTGKKAATQPAAAPSAKARKPRTPSAAAATPARGRAASKQRRTAVTQSAPAKTTRPRPPTGLGSVSFVLNVDAALREWRALRGSCNAEPRVDAPSAAGSPARASYGGVDTSTTLAPPSNRGEVNLEERTRLLSAISHAPSTYPQLHNIFFPPVFTGDLVDGGNESGAAECEDDDDEDVEVEDAIEAADNSTPIRWRVVRVQSADAVVATETAAAELLSLLHVLHFPRDRSILLRRMYRDVWTAALEAIAARVQRTAASPAVGPRRVTLAIVMRAAAEVYRPLLLLNLGDFPSWMGYAKVPRRWHLRVAATHEPMQRLLLNAVAPAFANISALVGPVSPLQPPALADGREYGDAAALLMAFVLSITAAESSAKLSKDAWSVDPAMAKAWVGWQDAAHAALLRHLSSVEAAVEDSAVETAAVAFADVLNCLVLLEEFSFLFSPATQAVVEETCRSIARRVCRVTDASRSAELFVRLCVPSVTAQLCRLAPGRQTYVQVVTDICTAATVFLRTRPEQLDGLLGQLEAQHRSAVSAANGADTAAPRPPMNSALSRLLYAMLCAGFPPEALLTSSLCVSLSPRDAVDVVRIVGRFSRAAAMAPLPVRTRVLLVDSVASRLEKCVRDRRRVVADAADAADESAGGPFDLQARLERGCGEDIAMPGAAATLLAAGTSGSQAAAARKRRRGKQGARGKRGDAAEELYGAASSRTAAATAPSSSTLSVLLTPAVYRRHVDQVLYVAMEVIVEVLRRGDAPAVQTLVTALMPLLLQEGGEAASADALEWVWANFRARLAEVGCDDVVRDQTERSAGLDTRSAVAAAAPRAAAPLQLSVDVERALALLPTMFLPPLSEAAVKLVAAAQLHTGAIGAGASPQHQRAVAAYHEPVSSTPAVTVEQLTEWALRLSTAAVLCGMPSDTVVQLTALHNTLSRSQGKGGAANSPGGSAAVGSSGGTERAADSGAPARAVAAAFGVVERLERLLSQLSRQSQALVRHPQSSHTRNSAVAVQQLLAIYITSTAGVAREMMEASHRRGAGAAAGGAASVQAQYRRYLLTVAHLLYRLRTEHRVEVEPPALRTYRVEVLDPALTSAMAGRPGATAMPLPLTTLTEVTVVMCVPESVQHVSPDLVRGVVAAVQQHVASRQSTAASAAAAASSVSNVADTATGVLSSQLLCAAATLCLRADNALTCMLMELLDLLSPLLSATQTVTVLQRLHATGAPLASPSLRRLVERLVVSLRQGDGDGEGDGDEGVARVAAWKSMSAGQRIGMLHTLSAIQRTAEATVDDADTAALLQLLHKVPFSSLLHLLVLPQHLAARRYTIGECGLLVEVVARLRGGGTAGRSQSSSSSSSADTVATHSAVGMSTQDAAPPSADAGAAPSTSAEAEAVRLLPRTLALYAMQAVQHSYNVHDVPLLLRGYAALSGEHHLQQQVLRAFIARTMRGAPALSPEEVVQCVEAYCAGGIVHVQLYGVLLGRVADLGRKFSLELAVRLLQCGVRANDASVRTVCVTAVQPVFSAQVRGLLQSDPHMLVTVASTALAIIHCLRDCFPQDDIGAAVLANVVRYQRDASLSVIKAALELAERRGSADYDVVHLLARHCTERVMPTCSAADLASVFYLLIACGLRSAAVMEATYKRLAEVCGAMSSHALTRLAQGLLRASVEVDISAMETLCNRIAELTAAPPVAAAGGRTRKGKRAVAATAAVPAAAPLSVQQVCVLLQLMRSVSGRVMTGAMSTVDVLLAYTQSHLTREEEKDGGGAAGTGKTRRAAAPTPVTADAADTAGAAPPYQPPAFLVSMTLHDMEGLLRACIDLAYSPKAYQRLTRCLADYSLHVVLQDASSQATPATAGAGSDGRAPPERLFNDALLSPSRGVGLPSALTAASAWQTDLILLVDLCSLFIRLGEAAHPVVVQLLERQYERRSTLLQRALLVKTTKQSLEALGPDVHPALYKVVVDGELI